MVFWLTYQTGSIKKYVSHWEFGTIFWSVTFHSMLLKQHFFDAVVDRCLGKLLEVLNTSLFVEFSSLFWNVSIKYLNIIVIPESLQDLLLPHEWVLGETLDSGEAQKIQREREREIPDPGRKQEQSHNRSARSLNITDVKINSFF